MATTYTGKIGLSLLSVLRDDLDLADPADIVQKTWQIAFTDGAGANQGNQQWHDRRTVATSATDTLDLNGSLTNQYGTTVSFARVKLLLVYNETGGGQLQLRPGASNAWANLFPGLGGTGHYINSPGIVMHYAGDATGWAVSAGSDTIRLVNQSGSLTATYNILIVGSTT